MEGVRWPKAEPPMLVSGGLALAAVVSCLTVAGVNAARADVQKDAQAQCEASLAQEQSRSDHYANATLARILEDQNATERELEQLQMLTTELVNRLAKADSKQRERLMKPGNLIITDDALFVKTMGMTLPFTLRRASEAEGSAVKGTIVEIVPVDQSAGSELGLTLPARRLVFRRDETTNQITGIDFLEQ